ncbi:MAG: CoA transferase [Chloroflexi bacterium]|nr:CoA transferase [Chloroflexota bacterium]
MTYYIAGPVGTQVLADLGAEVIKVEGPFASARTQAIEVPSNGSSSSKVVVGYSGFSFLNRNKKSVVLNLATPQGKDLFKKLVRISDVVVENYSLRVMRNFGLEYPALKELNPKIIMISMPGYGREGPYKEYASWGETIESTSGLTHMTGYEDGPPMRSAIYMPDPLSGMNAALAAIVCLNQRAKTGLGQHVTISHLESATQLSGEAILDYAMNGRNQRRQGNRNDFQAPHGIYRCKGGDEWVAIAVSSDEQWHALCDVLGSPEWTRLPEFGDALSRHSNQDALDNHLSKWTKERTKQEAMKRLQDAGVPAGAVLNSEDLASDPHLTAREYLWEYGEMLTDGPMLTFPGGRAKYEGSSNEAARRAPAFGEDNAYVLNELLGLSEAEIQKLRDLEVTMDILHTL